MVGKKACTKCGKHDPFGLLPYCMPCRVRLGLASAIDSYVEPNDRTFHQKQLDEPILEIWETATHIKTGAFDAERITVHPSTYRPRRRKRDQRAPDAPDSERTPSHRGYPTYPRYN